MLLTGYTDLESVIMAVNKGQIFRYLTKPWDPIDLSNTVDHAAERFRIGVELEEKNQQLEVAFKELKSMDVAKSNFMILINHELKTPLTSILSFSSLLAESSLNDEDKLMVNRIQKAADKLKSIVDDVLLIVRADMNQLKIDKQGLILSKLDDIKTQEIDKLISVKNLQISSQIENYAIQVDIRLIKQVLQRLLHNSVKYAHDNTIVKISLVRSGANLRLSISNEGPKINTKVMEKILKPFFIDEDVMNHSTGTGLGLTICQSILKSHSSELHIENHANGVTSWFEVPLMV
jgi:two-component system sensor histidine kinase/response regulator